VSELIAHPPRPPVRSWRYSPPLWRYSPPWVVSDNSAGLRCSFLRQPAKNGKTQIRSKSACAPRCNLDSSTFLARRMCPDRAWISPARLQIKCTLELRCYAAPPAFLIKKF
jgi:hypothetical protein